MADYLTPKTGAFGQSAAPLIATLEKALDGYKDSRAAPREQRLLDELALRVANTHALEALPVLVRYLKATEETQALEVLLRGLREPQNRLTLAQLLGILPLVRPYNAALTLFVAEVLVAKAEQERTRDFAEALPLLQSGLADPSAPLEFIGLRKRLQEALKGHNFPIPAEAPRTEKDLPLPSQKETKARCV